MKYTAQLAILTGVLFTFVTTTPMKGRQMISVGSSNIRSVTRRDNGCSKKKTCTDCIAVRGASGNLCGFSVTAGCVALHEDESELSKLARTTAECKAVDSEQNAQQLSNDALNVDAAWNAMKIHVFGGGKKATAGTHLTKAWKAKDPEVSFQSNEETGLSVTQKSDTNKNTKTLWNNNGEPGHQYTEDDVKKICKTAIGLALKKLKTDKLPTKNTSLSFSVNAFGTTSCFPMNQKSTKLSAGEQCR